MIHFHCRQQTLIFNGRHWLTIKICQWLTVGRVLNVMVALAQNGYPVKVTEHLSAAKQAVFRTELQCSRHHPKQLAILVINCFACGHHQARRIVGTAQHHFIGGHGIAEGIAGLWQLRQIGKIIALQITGQFQHFTCRGDQGKTGKDFRIERHNLIQIVLYVTFALLQQQGFSHQSDNAFLLFKNRGEATVPVFDHALLQFVIMTHHAVPAGKRQIYQQRTTGQQHEQKQQPDIFLKQCHGQIPGP